MSAEPNSTNTFAQLLILDIKFMNITVKNLSVLTQTGTFLCVLATDLQAFFFRAIVSWIYTVGLS
jgi:hypothetical protein